MFKPLLSQPTISYCEQALEGIVKRPYYAISNIPIILTSILIIYTGKGSLISKQFGISTLLIGLLSLIYDSTFTYISQILDLSGMLLFVNLLIYLNLGKIFKHKYILVSQLTMFVLSISLILMFQGYTGNIVFGIYILIVLLSERYLVSKKIHTHFDKWIFSFILFLFGFVFWILDTKGIYCIDFGLLNGRAIFHYLDAIVMYQIYRYYCLQHKTTS